MSFARSLLYSWFVIRLSLVNLVELIRLGLFLLRQWLRQHKLSGLVYIFIAIELLVLIGQIINVSLILSSRPNFNAYQFTTKQLSLSSVTTYQLSGNNQKLSLEMKKYEKWLELQPNHRDLLINYALLQTLLNQGGDSTNSELKPDLIKKASGLDPNWPGFVSLN
ncbi:MAG: hypothetical protein GF381_04660 [Candidatus Pacebacteria bacterium]|nr:hypothetical protein [Candidatus Paceibacterota bacterium]